VDEHPDFERVAPVPFAVICFRAAPRSFAGSPPELDVFNEQLLDAVNRSGDVFLSHTRLGGRFVISMAIGHLRTTREHTGRAWQLLTEHTAALASARAPGV
jgi:aromatic-L-amino-acid decarboxylase